MTQSSSTIRLGFFLERVGVNLLEANRPYRGMDRLPYLPTLEEEESLHDLGRHRLLELWDQYCDVRDSGELNVNRNVAWRLQRKFLVEGITLETVYGEITRIPDNLDQYPHGALWLENLVDVLSHWRNIQDILPERPENVLFLGFDVSHPVPDFHSAIFQPGLSRIYPRLSEHLNRDGLFDESSEALSAVELANSLDYGGLPFCMIGVWQVSPA